MEGWWEWWVGEVDTTIRSLPAGAACPHHTPPNEAASTGYQPTTMHLTNDSLIHAPQTTNQVEWERGHLVFFSSANEIQCALNKLQSLSQTQEQPSPSSSAAEATTTEARKPSKGTARRHAYLLQRVGTAHRRSSRAHRRHPGPPHLP